jgi:hypothetical protein
MHIERVPNRNSPPAVLLRQSYREGGKVRKRTLANLSKLPDETVEGLRILLKGGTAINKLENAFACSTASKGLIISHSELLISDGYAFLVI